MSKKIITLAQLQKYDALLKELLGVELAKKVNIVEGKGLSTEDFTTELKSKLEGLSNYNDTELTTKINGAIERIVELEKVDHSHENADILAGMTASFTAEEKAKLAGIAEGANKYELPADVVQDGNYVHTDNNYDAAAVAEVAKVASKADQSFVEEELAKKVDKEGYIAFTQAEKEKLAGIAEGANKYELPSDVVQDGEYKHITVTSTSVSDGTNTFEKYVLPSDVVQDAQYSTRMTAVEAGVAGIEGKVAAGVQEAKDYTDELKSTILGDNTKLVDTYDTLEEIGNWISSHEGSTVVELTTAISNEEKARKEADEAIVARVVELEKVDHDHSNKDVLDGTTASFTSELLAKLNGIEEGANKYVLPEDVVQDASYVHTDNNYDATAVAEVAKVANKADKSYVDDNFVLSADIVYAEEADIVALFTVAE